MSHATPILSTPRHMTPTPLRGQLRETTSKRTASTCILHMFGQSKTKHKFNQTHQMLSNVVNQTSGLKRERMWNVFSYVMSHMHRPNAFTASQIWTSWAPNVPRYESSESVVVVSSVSRGKAGPAATSTGQTSIQRHRIAIYSTRSLKASQPVPDPNGLDETSSRLWSALTPMLQGTVHLKILQRRWLPIEAIRNVFVILLLEGYSYIVFWCFTIFYGYFMLYW